MSEKIVTLNEERCRHAVGQQEIHEHEAPGGAGKQRLRCGITGFIYWTDLLTNLRITIENSFVKGIIHDIKI